MESYCKVHRELKEVCSVIVKRNEYGEELKSSMHKCLVRF